MTRDWIFLRGLAREAGHWGEFNEMFSARIDGRVHAIDLPGTGAARDVLSPTSIAGIVEFVRIQARASAPGPYHLLTVSLGAMVALEWQRLYPDEVAGSVVINTSAGNLSRFYHRLRWQIWSRFAKLSAVATPRERERAIIELLINDPDARARAWPSWSKIAAERPISPRTFAAQMWAASRSVVRPARGSRGLILSGLGDRLVDPSCSTALAAATDWPIKRHPWAGHDLPWDDPAWVIDRVAAWVG